MRKNKQTYARSGDALRSVLSHDQLLTLFQVSQKIIRISDLQELLKEILHEAIANLGGERGMLILVEESGESYRTVASESLRQEDVTFSKSIVKKTLVHNKTQMSADIQSDPRFKDADSVARLNILSFICVPLTVPGRHTPLGTLYIDQRIHKKVFTKNDAIFLEAFTNLAAIAISTTAMMEQLVDENILLRKEIEKKYEFPGVIGVSKAMHKIFREMKQILNDDCTVLITGESGTGKEVIAKAIHYNGNRKDKPFLAINCGALPETLLEAELFGSVRGAFTDAVDKQGLFQAAHGGTLFLDEIHHTSEAMQIKLLRVLQNREIRRVGGTSATKINVRLICATNEDLKNTIEKGRFRKDFYYRINVVTINVPPLRERREDIPLLAKYFLTKYTEQKKKHFPGFSNQAIHTLMNYDWTENNVRELENEIERTVIFTKQGHPIKSRDLTEKIREGMPPEGSASSLAEEKDHIPSFETYEKQYILHVLAKTNGNQTKAAEIMGIPRTTLRGRMKKLGLSV